MRLLGQILWFSGAALAAPGYLLIALSNKIMRKTET